MTLTIVSDQKQYEELLKHSPDIINIKILCDNLSFKHFLDKNNVDYFLLEESLLRENWKDINTWCCDKALNWNVFFEEDTSLFSGVKLNEAMYVFFSYYLVAFLKNYLYVKLICRKYKPREVIVFKNIASRDFPFFNSNYFLNLLFGRLSRKFGYKVRTIHLKREKIKGKRRSVKEEARKLFQKAYPRFQHIDRKKDVFMACGGLKHLAPVLRGLKKKGHNVMFYDFEFHLENLRFCFKEKIDYFVPDSFLSRKNNYIFDYEKDFMKLINMFRDKRWFSFFGDDLTDMLCDEIRTSSRLYLESVASSSQIYTCATELFNITGVIVDEDWSPRLGFMAAFLKSRGVKVFCICHGYYAQTFTVDKPKRNFSLSETFVNSKFEKNLFGAIGWREDHIHVTGSPKYDRLVEKRDKDSLCRRDKPTILYCGSSLCDFTLTEPSPIGILQFQKGVYMRDCLKNVLRSIDGFDLKLIARPHPWDIAEEGDRKLLWAELLKEYARGSEVILSDVNIDFYDLLRNCDAMIISYWTPAIVEAIIMNVPTFVLNPAGAEDGFPFAKEGLCESAQDVESLRRFIGRICASFNDRRTCLPHMIDPQKRCFYAGEADKKNTMRAMDKILSLVNQKSIFQRR